jgi:hypothetical protein
MNWCVGGMRLVASSRVGVLFPSLANGCESPSFLVTVLRFVGVVSTIRIARL